MPTLSKSVREVGQQWQYVRSFPLGTWCSGITSASHAESPGFKSQCVHLIIFKACLLMRVFSIAPLQYSSRRGITIFLEVKGFLRTLYISNRKRTNSRLQHIFNKLLQVRKDPHEENSKCSPTSSAAYCSFIAPHFIKAPPAGLEPAIFGLEVRRLVH